MARVDAEPYGDVHGLIELGERRALQLLAWAVHQSTTSSPMDRAVPAIIFMALSRSDALRSAILISAIFLTCARVTRPTLVRLGCPLPFSTPASFRRRLGAGG